MSEVQEGVRFISVSDGWVTAEMNKQAIDYLREGIALKAAALEREVVVEGEDMQPNLDFANGVKDQLNILREQLEALE